MYREKVLEMLPKISPEEVRLVGETAWSYFTKARKTAYP